MTRTEPRRGEMLGALLGNYRVLSKLGEGGMGVVYVGRHETLGHSVVVKVLQPELSSNAEMVQRFFNEAQAAAAIRNMGIVQVFDFGTTPDGRAYFVMELLDGQNLGTRLKQRRLGYLECCRIARQIANVLAAAHARGITHRDLKPENLFLVPDAEAAAGERVKVLDFGIAKLAGEAHTSGVKTRTGLIMGTPQYMSPEQCRGAGAVDARADIYSLGCILFEMACGRPPFVAEGAGEILGAHQYLEPPHPQSLAPDIPPALAALIVQMLAKRPEARPQTMSAVSAALDEILQGFGVTPRPSTPPPLHAQTPAPLPVPTAAPMPSPITVPMHAPSSTPPARPQALRSAGEARHGVAQELGAGSTTLRDAAGVSNVRERPPTRRLPFVLAGVVVTIAVVATVIAVASRGSGASERAGSRDEAARGSADAAIPDATQVAIEPSATPDAAEVPVAPTSPPDVQAPTADEAECLRYASERKWADLDMCATRLMSTHPKRGQELKDRAVLEAKAMSRIEAFEDAMRERNLKKARAELDRIPTQVTDYPKLKQRYETAENAAIQDVVAKLKGTIVNGDCKQKDYDQIIAQEAASKPARVAQEAKRLIKCAKTPANRDSPQPPCDADALDKKAIEHYSMGQLGMAMAIYEASWLCKNDPSTAQKAFIPACNLQNLQKAKLFWKRMTQPLREKSVNICVRNGITQEMLEAP